MVTISQVIADKSTFPINQADSGFLTELQTKLKELNYYFVPVDGLYGPSTAGAWAQFKSDYSQSSPEIVGPGSLGLLANAKPRNLSNNAAFYNRLWNGAQIQDHAACDQVIDRSFIPHRGTYQEIQGELSIPWYVIACLHYRESDCDFRTHLFNGDPLSHRTVNVPAGQPVHGNPPFTWAYSAKCALEYDGLNRVNNWSIESLLYECEKFNGMGYHHLGINSPYLWANTNRYQAGKYVADGRFSATAVDQQLGIASLLKRMQERQLISIY